MAIRPMESNDTTFMEEMLYAMVYVRPGESKPPMEEVLTTPSIAHYVTGLGTKTSDRAFVAVDANGNRVGAAWYRLFTEEDQGYGFVGPDIPELGIAVCAGCRGQGIGTQLLQTLITQACRDGYRHLSLSVDPDNPALNLYQRSGFRKVGESGTSWTMQLDLPSTP